MSDPCGADILIVDNDDRIVELVAWFLKKRGYVVRTAASFEEARSRIVERGPELMLSDVDLGAENALDELPRLAREGLLPPTLIVSGYLDADTVAALEKNEAVLGTLPKPFDFTVLEERVLACLRQLRSAPPRAPEPAIAGDGPFDGPTERGPAPAATGDPAQDREDDDGWIEITPQVPPRAPSQDPTGARDAPAARPGPVGYRDAGRSDGLAPFRLQ